MLHTKNETLRPLIESTKGIHITCYIRNDGNPHRLRVNLRKCIVSAKEFLKPAVPEEEIADLLKPIRALLEDEVLLSKLHGNIGLFRKADSFRIVNLPIDVENTCVVATSFHVKPLLRWMQADRDFLVVTLKKDSATLHSGNQKTLRHIDTLRYLPNAAGERTRKLATRRLRVEETLEWLNERLFTITKGSRPRVYVVGDTRMSRSLARKLRYPDVEKLFVPSATGFDNIAVVAQEIRQHLQNEARSMLELALVEYFAAEKENRGRKNLFQIASLATQGQVSKLIVADGTSIFGKLDPKKGLIAVHAVDLDHEDDDILDDLAQSVLSQGGEVVVAERDALPNGYSALAILNRPGHESRKYLVESKPPAPLQRKSV